MSSGYCSHTCAHPKHAPSHVSWSLSGITAAWGHAPSASATSFHRRAQRTRPHYLPGPLTLAAAGSAAGAASWPAHAQSLVLHCSTPGAAASCLLLVSFSKCFSCTMPCMVRQNCTPLARYGTHVRVGGEGGGSQLGTGQRNPAGWIEVVRGRRPHCADCGLGCVTGWVCSAACSGCTVEMQTVRV